MNDREIGLDELACRDLARSTALEWVDANGRGGYASGTVSGLPTRRYHGLLVVASHAPHARVMLVNHLAEWLQTPAGLVALSTARTVEASEPVEDGYRRCQGFSARPMAAWTYAADDLVIVRSIICPRGRDAVIVQWRLLGAHQARAVRLIVKPMLTARRDHAVASAEDALADGFRVDDQGVSWRPRAGLPRIHARGADSYDHAPGWRRGIEYEIDRERGEVHREDWWCPGALSLTITSDEPAHLMLSGNDTRDDEVRTAFDEEVERRRAKTKTMPSRGALHDHLVLGAETYLVEVEERVALLAGFPWFDVWTRDTFTSFGGLLLVTEQLAVAERVLQTFAPLVDQGLLPNNLPDTVTTARWTSADASLWFIVAVGRYAQVASDRTVLDLLWPAARAIIAGYTDGTAHVSIRVAEDGLVHASSDSDPLTWMDAKCDGRVITPRRGKAVEIQALWIQALGVVRDLAKRLGHDAQIAALDDARTRAIASFRARFWYEAGGFLYDVIDGPDGDDATLRPNQLFALSFDADLVSEERGRRVLELTRRKLLTPKGLRTLPEDDPRFHPRYEGPRSHRDAAYHQGTVWPFLLAPFVTAWLRYHGRSTRAHREAASFLRGISEHLVAEGCLGHLSEIFDGTPPYAPRGCFAQAWSLGEILLALKAINP